MRLNRPIREDKLTIENGSPPSHHRHAPPDKFELPLPLFNKEGRY
jgi:hypothetical protein